MSTVPILNKSSAKPQKSTSDAFLLCGLKQRSITRNIAGSAGSAGQGPIALKSMLHLLFLLMLFVQLVSGILHQLCKNQLFLLVMSQTPWQTHWLEMPGLWRCLLQQTLQFVGNLGISIPSQKSSTRSLIPTWTDILIQIHQLPRSCHRFSPQKDPLIE